MRQAVLVGTLDTKRTIYLQKAAKQAGLSIQMVEWKDWQKMLPVQDMFIKIDPPRWKSAALADLKALVEGYEEDLCSLERQAKSDSIAFLNHPLAIMTLLDKRLCKKILAQRGLPVTDVVGREPMSEAIHTMEELLELMKEEAVCQVFIKPVYGSGALGVSAFRIQPRTGRMVLYTCVAWEETGGLVNTKRLVRLSDRDKICKVLDALLQMDCIVERWYAKAKYQGDTYDLRAVVQDGRMDILLARLSKGPITNLQLNNHPLAIEALQLSSDIIEQIEKLCKEAMTCFTGLRSAGIDLLLERGSLRPRIIEMNAQGDLIYQDIYGQNKIYCHQIEMIKAWFDRADSTKCL